MKMELERYLLCAFGLVDETRALILERVQSGFHARRKADSTFVTDVDLAAEQLLRDRLAEQFPDHGIVGEEFEATHADRSHTWVIDPIDGTRSFVAGVPLYGTLLALLRDGTPVLGIIDLPGLNMRYHAGRGLGAFRGAHRLLLDPGTTLQSEIIGTGERRQFVSAGREAFFDQLMHELPHVRTYCDCFGHALAIEGALGAMIDPGLRLWDYAATQILIEEAGGTFAALPRGEGETRRTDVICGKSGMVDALLRKWDQ